MSQQDAFERTLALLHEAALDDAHWPAASASVDELFGSTCNMLTFGADSLSGDVEILFTRLCFRGQRDEEFEREYFRVYYPSDERIPRLRKLPDSRIVHVTDLYTEQERKTSPTYNEVLARGGQNSLNVRLDGPGGSRIVFRTGDPVEPGSWSSAQLGMLEGLLPHLRQYVRVRHALAEAGALGTSLAELLGNTRAGVVQLDRDGRIVETNDEARALLRRGEGLSDRGGFLRASSPGENTALRRLLARALPPFGGKGESGSMTVSRSTALTRLVLHVTPVADRDSDYRVWRVAALVLAVDPASQARISPAHVSATLGLTRTEGLVAVLLAEGKTVRQIALGTSREESTIRWHVRQIFDKLGCSRQLEVAQLVLALAGLPVPWR